MKPKILAFAGSLRKESYNKQLIKIAAAGAQLEGGAVTLIELNDFPLPIYDADIEAKGIPDNAKQLKELFWQHEGLLIATPEYNSGITPLLKNTIDWVSRPLNEKEPFLSCYQGKTAALISASVGPMGGRRAVTQLHSILSLINCLVLPETYHAANASKGLGDEEAIKQVGKRLVQVLKKLA